MKKLVLLFTLIASSAMAQDRTLKLTSSDFVSGKTMTIKEGEYDKIRVENMYAGQIGIYDGKTSTGKKVSQCAQKLPNKNQFSTINSFDIDITCLNSGTYTMVTWACYMMAEMTLVIEPQKISKVSKSAH